MVVFDGAPHKHERKSRVKHQLNLVQWNYRPIKIDFIPQVEQRRIEQYDFVFMQKKRAVEPLWKYHLHNVIWLLACQVSMLISFRLHIFLDIHISRKSISSSIRYSIQKKNCCFCAVVQFIFSPFYSSSSKLYNWCYFQFSIDFTPICAKRKTEKSRNWKDG